MKTRKFMNRWIIGTIGRYVGMIYGTYRNIFNVSLFWKVFLKRNNVPYCMFDQCNSDMKFGELISSDIQKK